MSFMTNPRDSYLSALQSSANLGWCSTSCRCSVVRFCLCSSNRPLRAASVNVWRSDFRLSSAGINSSTCFVSVAHFSAFRYTSVGVAAFAGCGSKLDGTLLLVNRMWEVVVVLE
uniref:(northern house mosquito) hypothetical protein n=1 Tax=Culex pipiens TaxID=7175 RepID=A0A8D8D447_CULPI